MFLIGCVIQYELLCQNCDIPLSHQNIQTIRYVKTSKTHKSQQILQPIVHIVQSHLSSMRALSIVKVYRHRYPQRLPAFLMSKLKLHKLIIMSFQICRSVVSVRIWCTLNVMSFSYITVIIFSLFPFICARRIYLFYCCHEIPSAS